jgi:hypothetical protein
MAEPFRRRSLVRRWLGLVTDLCSCLRSRMREALCAPPPPSVVCACGHADYYHEHYAGRCEASGCLCRYVYPARPKVTLDDRGNLICSVCKTGTICPSNASLASGVCGHCRAKKAGSP